MPAQTLPVIGTAPSRSSPSTFSTRHDAMVTSLRALLAGLNTRITYLEGLSGTPVTVWVSGASYTVGQAKISPSNFKTYRAKTNHSGVSTDPSSDTTNWALAGGLIPADQAKLDLISISRAANLNRKRKSWFAVADGAITAGDVVVLKTATGKVASVTPSPTDADNWIGIAAATVADTETVEITLKGGVNLSQSGLTPGSIYYVDDDGNLTITTTGGRKLGKALSATSILITEGNA